MTDIAICVEGLGKRYRVGHQAERDPHYTALRDVIARQAKALACSTRDLFRGEAIVQGDAVEEFWALRDVAFEIRQGERVGIIGRNGAGKSTLLKILSRITEPTTGRVEVGGRVASLLEVGTGFHPELTGRENVFLNGAILGMSRREIQRKFDEIVDFAEVERFLDTPVKHFSSGMYMRLAFAVAAHLEPEILLVDEVLAVGDAQFQARCLGKMAEVGREGRTVLFVSHSMEAIERLCDRVIVFKDGRLDTEGTDVHGVIERYLSAAWKGRSVGTWTRTIEAPAHENFTLEGVRLCDAAGAGIEAPVRRGASLEVWIDGRIERLDPGLTVGIILADERGTTLYWSCSTDLPEERWPPLRIGPNRLVTTIPTHLLNEGAYTVEVVVSLHRRDWVLAPGKGRHRVGFTVAGGLSESPFWYVPRPGVLAPVIPWRIGGPQRS